MKSLQEIENISFEELERVAQDQSVKVPEDLGASVQAGVAAAALASKGGRPALRPQWRSLALLGALAAACIGVLFAIPRAPKDTYDDPLLAYAKVEETFSRISDQLNRGSESILQMEEPIETVNRIINKK